MGATRTSGPFGRRLRANGHLSQAGLAVACMIENDVVRRRLTTMLSAAGFAVSDSLVHPLDAIVTAGETGSPALLDRIRELRAEHPGAALVVVVSGDSRTAHDAIQAGADGVVPEARADALLAPTVHATCAGLVALPREARASLAKPVLSTREKQVLGMVVLGLANGEIATKLHLAETTVKSHLSSIFRKLGVRSRSEAAAIVLDADSGLGLGILTISDGGAA